MNQSGLVFAAIAPHGRLAVAEACTPDELRLARVTRKGMKELDRAFTGTRPDVVVVATPHNVHIAGAFAVIVAGRIAGSLDGTPRPVALDVPSDNPSPVILPLPAGEKVTERGVSGCDDT